MKQRSVVVPFESRYLAQSISVEIRNDQLMSIIYEGTCQYDQLLSVAQYLDSTKCVSVSLREPL